MALIRIDMSDRDFDLLRRNAMEWCGQGWDALPDRFEYSTEPNWEYAYAYWVGDSWANVMLARSFLEFHGHAHEVIWDTAENPSYVILTDYASPVMK